MKKTNTINIIPNGYILKSSNYVMLLFVVGLFHYCLLAQVNAPRIKETPQVYNDSTLLKEEKPDPHYGEKLLKQNHEAMKLGLSGLKGYTKEDIDSMMAYNRRLKNKAYSSKPRLNSGSVNTDSRSHGRNKYHHRNHARKQRAHIQWEE